MSKPLHIIYNEQRLGVEMDKALDKYVSAETANRVNSPAATDEDIVILRGVIAQMKSFRALSHTVPSDLTRQPTK